MNIGEATEYAITVAIQRLVINPTLSTEHNIRLTEDIMRAIEIRAEELGLVQSSRPIAPGDKYLAERNTGPKVLTCKEVKDGYVVPVEQAYCFDLWECVVILPESCS